MSVRIHRVRNDYNYRVERDGLHVGAICEFTEGGKTHWRLWKDRNKFTDDELKVIDAFAAELNAKLYPCRTAKHPSDNQENDDD